MSAIDPTNAQTSSGGLLPTAPGAAALGANNDAQLTPAQKKALANLHTAATQLEGVFMQMVMNAMQDTVPKESIFGNDDASESSWQSMLNDQRSQDMAKNGGMGLARSLEKEMRERVLTDADQESKVNTQRGNDL
jgi:Rod binding domain-containing protein